MTSNSLNNFSATTNGSRFSPGAIVNTHHSPSSSSEDSGFMSSHDPLTIKLNRYYNRSPISNGVVETGAAKSLIGVGGVGGVIQIDKDVYLQPPASPPPPPSGGAGPRGPESHPLREYYEYYDDADLKDGDSNLPIISHANQIRNILSNEFVLLTPRNFAASAAYDPDMFVMEKIIDEEPPAVPKSDPVVRHRDRPLSSFPPARPHSFLTAEFDAKRTQSPFRLRELHVPRVESAGFVSTSQQRRPVSSTIPSGTISKSSIPSGTVSKGTILNGTVSKGTVPNGLPTNREISQTSNSGTVRVAVRDTGMPLSLKTSYLTAHLRNDCSDGGSVGRIHPIKKQNSSFTSTTSAAANMKPYLSEAKSDLEVPKNGSSVKPSVATIRILQQLPNPNNKIVIGESSSSQNVFAAAQSQSHGNTVASKRDWFESLHKQLPKREEYPRSLRIKVGSIDNNSIGAWSADMGSVRDRVSHYSASDSMSTMPYRLRMAAVPKARPSIHNLFNPAKAVEPVEKIEPAPQQPVETHLTQVRLSVNDQGN